MAVRLCCGQEHAGSVCPDGRVMCCLCFGLFEVKDLNVVEGPDGPAVREDVCVPCANHEDEDADIRREAGQFVVGYEDEHTDNQRITGGSDE